MHSLVSLFGGSAKAQVPPEVQARIDAGAAAIRSDPEFKKRQEILKRSVNEDRFDLFVADKQLPGNVVAEVHLKPNHRNTIVVWEGYQKQAVYAQGQLIARGYIMWGLPSSGVLQIHSNGAVTLADGSEFGQIHKAGPDSSGVGKRIERALKTKPRENHPDFGHGRLVTAEELAK